MDTAAADQTWKDAMRAGQVHFQRGDLAKAARAFSKATQLQPARVEGWVNLGSTLLNGRQFIDAEKTLKTAIALNAKLMAAHMLLGDAQRLQGNTDAALRSYRAAVGLERSPMALNKLACALRSQRHREEAQTLYEEALRMAPAFTLAQVNLATLQIERREYAQARQHLDALDITALPAAERSEAESARLCLNEHERLRSAIEQLTDGNGLAELKALLANLPKPLRAPDSPALENARGYLQCAKGMGKQSAQGIIDLPQEWPLIEGLFMIPLANNVSQYLETKHALDSGAEVSSELRESINMATAIEAARDARHEMSDPVAAEAQLRYWHALTGIDVPDYSPGHFKYTQNWAAKNPDLKRVNPHQSSATLQHFINEMYPKLRPGIVRAAVSFITLLDLHCFADGNGRVLMIWLNRELEWNGLMPALFHRDISLKGDLGKALRIARNQDGDLAPLISVIQRGQAFAGQFLAELESAKE